MKLEDPEGKEIDVSAIYAKDSEGRYKYKFVVKAFEAFANSKFGYAELKKYAKKRQVIAGRKFNQEGEYHKNGIDLALDCGLIPSSGATGETGGTIREGRFLTSITLCNVSNDNGGSILESICHEVFIHAHHNAKDYSDDKTLNNSDFSVGLKTFAEAGGLRQNYAEEQLYSFRMKQLAVPILRDFFKGDKSDKYIYDMINGGLKFSKIK